MISTPLDTSSTYSVDKDFINYRLCLKCCKRRMANRCDTRVDIDPEDRFIKPHSK